MTPTTSRWYSTADLYPYPKENLLINHISRHKPKSQKTKSHYPTCHNPSLRLATKARARDQGKGSRPRQRLVTKARVCKGASQQWSLRVTFHVPGSVGKCEGMNPHTPKWVPTLGIGIPTKSQIFKRQLQGSKLIELKISLYHWKYLEM
jgi:hypothetical protein